MSKTVRIEVRVKIGGTEVEASKLLSEPDVSSWRKPGVGFVGAAVQGVFFDLLSVANQDDSIEPFPNDEGNR